MADDFTFGKYTVLQHLGTGGMAEVFKCRLSGIGGFDKVVVVKCIRPECLDDPEFLPMFMDEARIAANLNHPNIAQVFEIGEVEGVRYIAMEYVPGPTLSTLLRAARKQGKFHLGHVVKALSGIAAGLHYAHHARDSSDAPMNIVHRDVSPQNILVSTNGTPKLVDFGVAKAVGRLTQTHVGMFKGKLRYTAPEQFRSLELDFRADIYSLGVCLFEATTGYQRFRSQDEVAMVKEATEGRVLAPTKFLPDYPPELERILLWALEPEREKRCPSAHELHLALEQFVASGPYVSSTASLGQWTTELFPETGSEPLGRSYGLTPTARSPTLGLLRPRTNSSHLVAPMASARLGRRRLAAIAAAVGLLLVGAWLVLRPVIKEALPPPPPVASPQPPPSPDTVVSTYLDEAERLASERRFGPALELLDKARALDVANPSLVIRLARLADTLERDSLLGKARAALGTKDAAMAVEVARLVLERDPENEEAMRIFTEAHKLAPAAPPSDRPFSWGHRLGFLSITSEPAGLVYLNGEPLGYAPISRYFLRAGKHQLQVRLVGYQPWEQEVVITRGRLTRVSAVLEPNTGSKGSPSTPHLTP